MHRISAFVLPRGLITVRLTLDFDIAAVTRRWEEIGAQQYGVGALVHGLLDVVVDSHFAAVEALDDCVEAIEDELFDGKPRQASFQRRTFQMRRDLVGLRRVALPMREVVNSIQHHRHEVGTAPELDPLYADLYDHVLRVSEWTESLRDMVTTIFETNLSLQDARLNTIMKKLTGWAAIIAVPTAITGFYGQNVPYPGFGHLAGFLASTSSDIRPDGGDLRDVQTSGLAMTADLLPELAAPNTALVAAAPVDEVLRRLDSSAAGLSSAEAAARLTRYGPNAVRTHHVNALAVLGRQLRNAVLILLAGTAIVSYFLGDSMQATIIGIILAASIGLGFINEYRAERAAADLHASVHHNAVVRRDGEFVALAVTALVPGDVIRLSLGEAVPADVRLIDVSGLECNESILTGESTGSEKSPQPVPPGTDLADATDLAFMGTIVSAGEGTGVVYATGKNAEFGRIAAGLDERQPETGFQVGLRRFSYLLLQVAVALMVIILISNLLLRSRSSIPCCSRWRSRSGSRRSCCPPWSAPAWRPDRASWPKPRCS